MKSYTSKLVPSLNTIPRAEPCVRLGRRCLGGFRWIWAARLELWLGIVSEGRDEMEVGREWSQWAVMSAAFLGVCEGVLPGLEPAGR